MQLDRLPVSFILLVILLMASGCAGTVNPILLETSLQDAQNAILNAQRVQATLAPDSVGTEEYAKEQIEKATKLMEEAQDAQLAGDGSRSLELAFQAQIEARIAAAQVRQRVYQAQIDKAHKDRLSAVLEAMEYQIKTAQTRQAIAEEREARALARAARAEERADIARAEATEARADKQNALIRTETKLAISEAQLYLDAAEEVEAMTHATSAYQAAQKLINQAVSLMNQEQFNQAKTIAAQAREQAKAARIAASAVINKTQAAKANVYTDAKISITRAQVEIDRAESINAFIHAEEFYQHATSKLKEANAALQLEQYDQVLRLAGQAEGIAREAYNISEPAERQRKAGEAQKEQIAQAKDAIFKATEGINREQRTLVPDLAPELYKQAKTSLTDAQTALSKNNYQHTITAGRKSIEALNRAIEKAKQIEAIEARIIEAATAIPSAEIGHTKKGVMVRFSGNLFKSGSEELNPAFFPRLTQLSGIIKVFTDANVLIEGHSDSSGSADANLRLTKKRANAFMKHLAEKCGVPTERMTAVGLGESQPIATNMNKPGQARNRRIDTIILTRERAGDN
jgi:outer membrane protein OmpA-like peptidoglycan-associated protein